MNTMDNQDANKILSDDLLNLIQIGVIKKDVQVLNNLKVAFISLNGNEEAEVFKQMKDVDNTNATYRFDLYKKYVLAYSIKKVNDKELDINSRINLIFNLQSNIISSIWEEYTKNILGEQTNILEELKKKS
jgi:Golgi nucleoside diphosphatase